MKNLKPLNDKILIREIKVENTTEGGLFIPDLVKDEATEGVVVSVGEGVTLQDGSTRPLTVKEGDKVLFMPNTGIPIKLEHGDYKILSIGNIIAKIID